MAARVIPIQHAGRVRWKVGDRGRWHYGHLDKTHVLETDGSLRVYDDHNGAARSLPTTAVQHETNGLRGGRRWVCSALAPKVIAAVDRVRKPTQGGLFDN